MPILKILHIGALLLDIFEHTHRGGYVHRDLKPDNVLLGRKKNQAPLYLIDFGLARKYMNTKTNQHSSYSENVLFKGNLIFCSKYSLVGVSPSRRDDIESLAYLLIYCATRSLPWQNFSLGQMKQIVAFRLST